MRIKIFRGGPTDDWATLLINQPRRSSSRDNRPHNCSQSPHGSSVDTIPCHLASNCNHRSLFHTNRNRHSFDDDLSSRRFCPLLCRRCIQHSTLSDEVEWSLHSFHN